MTTQKQVTLTAEELDRAIDSFSNEDVAVFRFDKLPQEFRRHTVEFFKAELEKRKLEKRKAKNKRRKINPDACYGRQAGNVCEVCPDECPHNPNRTIGN